MSDNEVRQERVAATRTPSVILGEWRESLGRMERLGDQTAEWYREWLRGKDLGREYQDAFEVYAVAHRRQASRRNASLARMPSARPLAAPAAALGRTASP